MTKEERLHKIKLVMLILICKAEITRRNPHKNLKESLINAIDASYWMAELVRLTAPIPKHKKGSVFINKDGDKLKVN